MKKTWTTSPQIIGKILLVVSIIGLLAGVVLLRDTFEVARNPDFSPVCNINPVLSCTSVMAAPQAQIFGLPSATLGIMGYSALLAFAALVVMGVKMPRKVWLAGMVAAALGLLFAVHLYITSIFELSTLCLWCFTTWVATIAVFWAFLTHCLASGYFMVKNWHAPKWMCALAKFWVNNAGLVLAIWYAALIFSILLKFNQALFL